MIGRLLETNFKGVCCFIFSVDHTILSKEDGDKHRELGEQCIQEIIAMCERENLLDDADWGYIPLLLIFQ